MKGKFLLALGLCILCWAEIVFARAINLEFELNQEFQPVGKSYGSLEYVFQVYKEIKKRGRVCLYVRGDLRARHMRALIKTLKDRIKGNRLKILFTRSKSQEYFISLYGLGERDFRATLNELRQIKWHERIYTPSSHGVFRLQNLEASYFNKTRSIEYLRGESIDNRQFYGLEFQKTKSDVLDHEALSLIKKKSREEAWLEFSEAFGDGS